MLLCDDAALESPEDTMQTKIWALQEELCQKAATVAELNAKRRLTSAEQALAEVS